MKKVDLSTMDGVKLFYDMFYLVPKTQSLVNRINQDLGWSIAGEGSQAFACSLVGMAGNIEALKWCADDTSRSVYRMNAAHCYQRMRDTEHFIRHVNLIKLPSWIYKSITKVRDYSHGPNSARLP